MEADDGFNCNTHGKGLKNMDKYCLDCQASMAGAIMQFIELEQKLKIQLRQQQ